MIVPIAQAPPVAPPAARPARQAVESFNQTLSREQDLTSPELPPVNEDAAAAESAVSQPEQSSPTPDEPVAQTETETTESVESPARPEAEVENVEQVTEKQTLQAIVDVIPAEIIAQPAATSETVSQPVAQSVVAPLTTPQAAVAAATEKVAALPTQSQLPTTTAPATTESVTQLDQSQPLVAQTPLQNTGDQSNQQTPQQKTQPLVLDAATKAAPVANVASPAPIAPVEVVAPSPVVQQVSAQPVAVAQPVVNANEAPDESLNAARLSRGLQSAVNQRGGAITLRLTPPEMGTVRIQLQFTGTTVSAQFHAETAQGQTLLSQQLGQLRQTLEGQGLHVDRLGVQAMQTNQSSSSQQQQQSSQQESRTDDGRSRGSFSQRQDQPRDRRGAEQTFNFEQVLADGNER